jgi:ubiquitin-activating enzyme E1
MQTTTQDLDKDRLSRIIPIMGTGNLMKLMSLKVLVSGLSGLGAEIAKNLILTGVGHVHLHDTETVKWTDLSSHFYLNEGDIGKNRAEACIAKLSELNPLTRTQAITSELNEELVADYKVVVITDCPSAEKLAKLSEFCHNNHSVFIRADIRGLFAVVFTDFGPEHEILDRTGEEPKQAIVTSISQSNPAVITTHEERPHGFGEGDFVDFTEVLGMVEINNPDKAKALPSADEDVSEEKVDIFTKPEEEEKEKAPNPLAAIKVLSTKGLYGLEIDLDTTNFSPYTGGGLINEVKLKEILVSKPYHEALIKPGEFMITDFAKFGRAEQLHFGFQALHEFQARHGGHLPEPGNHEQAAEVVAIAKELNERAKATEGVHKVEEIDEKLLTQLALTAQGNLNPMAAFLGGIVAQEVMKVTGKFKPIHQWFYFDSLECLPEQVGDVSLRGTRYDGQIAVFGHDFQRKLGDAKLFLVGAGALGCEFLKNFAMMGVAAGENGILYLTDMDNIEKSNLSRQFLFRDIHIGKMKSACAASAAKAMNPNLRLKTSEIPVGEDTEDTWNDDFWSGLDFVVNALDNVKARLYVDGQCVRFLKPLLESGTLGTKANSQVILPHLTESYGTSRDPPDTAIPLCTLKNFPHQIEHTIEWGRDKFQGFFANAIEDANNWVGGDEFVKSINSLESVTAKKERLEACLGFLRLFKDGQVDFFRCVEWARLQFEDLFRNTILQLLHNFPLDAKTSTGAPFWSGPKRPPTPLEFNPDNPTHIKFVIAAANLIAYNCRLPPSQRLSNKDDVKKLLENVHVPKFEPREGVRIRSGEQDETQEGSEDDEKKVDALLRELTSMDKSQWTTDKNGRAFEVAHFEKDDDTNFHIAFITHSSNLRAANYRIPPADFQKTKRIAGRIIPAISTTTAMITGLVGLELFKLVQGGLPMEKFRNSFANLALPSFVQSEPMPCKKNKSDPAKDLRYYPDGWTLWDSLVIDDGDITFKQLLEIFESKHNLVVTSVSCGSSLIYNCFFPNHKERLPKKLTEYVRDCVPSYKLKPTDKYLALVVLVEDADGNDVDIPAPVLVKFRA